MRDEVHAELTELLAPGGSLHTPPPEVDEALADPDLNTEIAGEYRALAPAPPRAGRALIVTAGPPGAGKSTAVESLAADHRRIDPDRIKDMLLSRLEAQGHLRDRLRHQLADGDVVSPAELAGWVHRASTDIADLVRTASLEQGENFVMEGTLAWEGLPDVYRAELAEYGYDQLTVIDVEVPLETAVARARHRWWTGRTSGDGQIGGRFIADAVIEQFYSSGNRRVSICVERARALYDVGTDLHMETSLRLVDEDVKGNVRTAAVTPSGAEAWAPFGSGTGRLGGAVCMRCGRPLTAAASIARGVGPGCARVR